MQVYLLNQYKGSLCSATLSLFLPTLCLPLQATTARCACGCWTTGRACRRSRPTGRSTTRPSMTWPSTHHSRSSPAPAQMHLPRSLSDSTVVIPVSHVLEKEAWPYFKIEAWRLVAEHLTGDRGFSKSLLSGILSFEFHFGIVLFGP